MEALASRSILKMLTILNLADFPRGRAPAMFRAQLVSMGGGLLSGVCRVVRPKSNGCVPLGNLAMSISRLKLYHYPLTRSARVKWILHELLGDDFDVEIVDLYGGAQYQPEYLGLNPNHGVPVLRISWSDGTTQHLIESASMVAFLADAYPEKFLSPQPGASRERADYLQMLHFGSTWMDMMLWQIRSHEHLLPEDQRDHRTLERYRAKFTTEIEPQLVARLERSAFICGDTFTAADCVIGHSVFWARGYRMCRGDAFKGYIRRLSERPAFQSAFADAKQFQAVPPADGAIVGLFTG